MSCCLPSLLNLPTQFLYLPLQQCHPVHRRCCPFLILHRILDPCDKGVIPSAEFAIGTFRLGHLDLQFSWYFDQHSIIVRFLCLPFMNFLSEVIHALLGR